MGQWKRLVAVTAAPLLLTGCLWGPGKFASTLDLRKDGSFALEYKGEILLQLPEDAEAKPAPWNDSMARCYRSGRTVIAPSTADKNGDDDPERPCSASEIAKLKAEHDKTQAEAAARKRQENEQMAKLFGLPGADEESSRDFAARLMKHAGWRSVTFKGKGVFEVDYRFEGRSGQDFVFPLMPDSDILVPFVVLRRRNDGTVMVTAPAFTGGSGPLSARAMMIGMPDKGEGPPSRAQGRFTVVTDGEILTNNSEDGPARHSSGRQLHWDVGPASNKVPETLIRL